MNWKFLMGFVYLFCSGTAQGPKNALISGVDKKDVANYYEYEYRLVNWCIVGQGEHTLYQWPFQQLLYFLLQANRGVRKFEDNLKENLVQSRAKKPGSITLELKKIQCQETKAYIGDGQGNYYQRIHVIIKSDVEFQGLVIQANHAPFGLGFPFGQFDIDSEFECSDCKHGFGKIIPCISRPDVSLMHPTVGSFHYMYRRRWDKYPVGQQKEVHFNFKWSHTECSSARIVEFWVLLILDFDRPIWIVEKFGPYEFHPDKKQQDAINPNQGYKTRVPQPFLPSPILPRCLPLPTIELEYIPIPSPPPTTPLPPNTTTTLTAPINGSTAGSSTTGSPDIPPVVCYRQYGKRYNATQCYLWKEHRRQKYLITEAPSAKSGDPRKPVFIRLKSQIKCEGTDNYFDINFDKKGIWSPIRFAGNFDTECVLFYNRQKKYGKEKQQTRTFRHPNKICSAWQANFICQDAADQALNAPWPARVGFPKRLFPLSLCDPCKKTPTTKAPKRVTPPPFIKRSSHGGMMTVAYFCLFPVSIIISRFYKETYNRGEIKGHKSWLCVHVIIGIIALLITYMSYTLPSFEECNVHIYVGYGACFSCVGALATGFVRNKDSFILKITFYLHTVVGYAGWALGIASMAVAPGIAKNFQAKMVCVGSGVFSLCAMLILTINICASDRKMEMQPGRSHIPIVEIRFNDIRPMGNKFRKCFLAFYIVFQILITGMMLTAPWIDTE